MLYLYLTIYALTSIYLAWAFLKSHRELREAREWLVVAGCEIGTQEQKCRLLAAAACDALHRLRMERTSRKVTEAHLFTARAELAQIKSKHLV